MFKIIEVDTLQELAAAINIAIQDGWIPNRDYNVLHYKTCKQYVGEDIIEEVYYYKYLQSLNKEA